MKWFVILAVIMGGYYFFLMESTNMAIGQVQHLEQQYTSIANQADQIAAGATPQNR